MDAGLCYNQIMKTPQIKNGKIGVGSIISIVLHAFTLFAITMMFHNIQILNTEAERLNKQALQFNGRTNNLEGCWINNDTECPEDKYFNSRQFWENN